MPSSSPEIFNIGFSDDSDDEKEMTPGSALASGSASTGSACVSEGKGKSGHDPERDCPSKVGVGQEAALKVEALSFALFLSDDSDDGAKGCSKENVNLVSSSSSLPQNLRASDCDEGVASVDIDKISETLLHGLTEIEHRLENHISNAVKQLLHGSTQQSNCQAMLTPLEKHIDQSLQQLERMLREQHHRQIEHLSSELSVATFREEQMATAAEKAVKQLLIGLPDAQVSKSQQNQSKPPDSPRSPRSSSVSERNRISDVPSEKKVSFQDTNTKKQVSFQGKASWKITRTFSKELLGEPPKESVAKRLSIMSSESQRERQHRIIGSRVKRFGGMSEMQVQKCGSSGDEARRSSDASSEASKSTATTDNASPGKHRYTVKHDNSKMAWARPSNGFLSMTSIMNMSKYKSKWRPQWVGKVLAHPSFDFFVGVVICLNTITIGLETHLTALRRGSPPFLIWRILDLLFCVIFAGELFLRIMNENMAFFFGIHWRWNWFDSLVVSFSLAEQSVSEAEGMGLLRFLRIVRIVRLVRVMRFLPDLRNMIYGIVSAVRSLFWSMVLLGMVMFIFAVLMTESVNMTFQDLPEDHPSLRTYADLITSIYQLFKAISGGVDWGQISDPLLDISWMCVGVFSAYIAFSVFCVLNIVAAVFVQQSNKICSQDKENIVQEEIAQRRSFLEEVERIFHEAHGLNEGMLTRQEFHSHFSTPRVRAILRRWNLDIEVFGTDGLFDILDTEDIGYVDVDTFKHGVDMLKGGAKSLDIFLLQHDVEHITQKVDEFVDKAEDNFTRLFDGIGKDGKEDEQGKLIRSLQQAIGDAANSWLKHLPKNDAPASRATWGGERSMSTSPLRPNPTMLHGSTSFHASSPLRPTPTMLHGSHDRIGEAPDASHSSWRDFRKSLLSNSPSSTRSSYESTSSGPTRALKTPSLIGRVGSPTTSRISALPPPPGSPC